MTSIHASLHHVAIRARDFDRSLRFYVEGLGLGAPYLWDHPPMVSRAAFLPFGDGTWIELFDNGTRVTPPGPDDTPQGVTHLAVAVDDVAAAFDRLVQAGGVALDGPATRTLFGEPPKEATMAFVAGPDGEVIELYRNDDL